MKKAQLYGQIFIYILTIVVVSLILLYGYRTIIGIKDRAGQVMALKFEKELKSSVKSITEDFGSIVKKEISVDEKADLVCFFDNYEPITDLNNPKSDDPANPISPIVKESIRSQSYNNIFILGDGLRSSFYAGSISIPDTPSERNVLCIKSMNRLIVFRLEGAGDHAIISRWT